MSKIEEDIDLLKAIGKTAEIAELALSEVKQIRKLVEIEAKYPRELIGKTDQSTEKQLLITGWLSSLVRVQQSLEWLENRLKEE